MIVKKVISFKKKLFIHLGIFFFLILLSGSAIFFFSRNILREVKDIKNVREQLSSWMKLVSSFATVRSEYTTKAQQYEQILENRLPQKELLIDLKSDIQFLAAAKGITANLNFNSENDLNSKKIGAIWFTLNLGGKYENTMNFISELKKLRYIISIESINISRRDDGGIDTEAKGFVFFKK